ncbi:MAG: hypothetical protein H7282_03025 [Cytophagaceae bacterium]|nr:hypothetical protein [Cytophagaceae bacterium]
MRFSFLVFLSLLLSGGIQAQTSNALGICTIKNYSAKMYEMHPRNFYIMQDQRGIMHFGNEYGIMEYDGNYWQSTHLTNGTSGYAMAQDKEGKLYIGCDNELGYLSYDSSGTGRYQSLYDKIPAKEKAPESFWEVISEDNTVFFFSASKIFAYRNGQFNSITPVSPKGRFTYAKKIGNSLYVQEQGTGLLILKNDKLTLVNGGHLLKDADIKALLPQGNNAMLVVEHNKISLLDGNSMQPFPGNVFSLLASHSISHCIELADKNLLIATRDNGFYIVNAQGDVLKNINIQNGLQSNDIHYAYLDSYGDLWLALDNGIAYLEINSPFSFIGYSSGLPGMGYSSVLFENKLYLGTSQGLFYTNWNTRFVKSTFKPVKGIEGQVWNLSIANNTLMCCQTNLLYQVKGDQAIKIQGIYSDDDNWKFLALHSKPGYAVKGTYTGFELYEFQNNTWKYLRKLEGFNESCRVFVEDDKGTLWVCHGNKGIYRIELSADLQGIASAENYNASNDFAPDFFLDVSLVNGHIVFASQAGVYRLDPAEKKIIKDQELEDIFGKDRYINKITQYEDGNIWLFPESDLFLYRKVSDKEYKTEHNVLHKLSGSLVGSYEFVMPLGQGLSIIGSQEGFVLFNTNYKSKKTAPFHVMVRQVEANFKNDSLLFGGNFTQTNGASALVQQNISEWDYNLNSLRISFSALFYEGAEKIIYQYALTPSGEKTKNWSGWTNNTQIVLSNLSEGEYSFYVRAKNIYGVISEESAYTFRILPPWYRSVLAYLLYALIIAGLMVLAGKYILYRFKRQKEYLEKQKNVALTLMEQEHVTEILRKEKELIAIRNQQLEENVIQKNNELASMATMLNQKTEFLVYLKEKFKDVDNDTVQVNPKLFKEVVKTIDQHFDFDDNWSNFQVHFDHVHHNFLQRLREKQPKLDQSWLLLCAYIRMNKSNKEIAAHMNISVAAVEKRRYRLKEKLDIDSDNKLVDYLLNF